MDSTENEIPAQKIKVIVTNPWALLLILALVYIIFDFVSLASQDFLLTYKGGKAIGWKVYLVIALVLVGVLFAITKWAKIPFIDFEQV